MNLLFAKPSSVIRDIVIVFASVALSTLARVSLNTLLGSRVAFITYFPALIFCAWIGGWRAGLMALVLSTVAASYLFVSPMHSMSIAHQPDQISLAIYVLVGLSICALGDAQRKRTQQLVESEERYRHIIETTSEGVWVIDAQGQTIYANLQMARMLGYTVEDMAGTAMADFMDAVGKKILTDTLEKPRRGVNNQHDVRFRSKEGSDVWGLIALSPLFNPQGLYSGALGMVIDITERKRAEQQLQARAERETLLNRIGQAIRISTEPNAIQEAAVLALGSALKVDRCYFSLIDVSSDSLSIGADFRRPNLPSLSGQYRLTDFQIDLSDYYPYGEPLVVEDLHNWSFPVPLVAALEQIRVRSTISVPLYKAGQIVATLAVAMADEPRSWTTEEVFVVEAVAIQTRAALEVARVRQRERKIASQLQTALQPPLPERMSGLQMAKFYEAALEEAGVGGDFYDVFPLDPNCTVLTVGDLSGKGLAAAAQVATVRNMLRAFLYSKESLAAAITDLNRVLALNNLLTGFATLFVATYDHTKRELRYVNCGQEPALIRRAETGRAEALVPTGPVLGMDPDGTFEERQTTLRPEDALAIFTDGVTECGASRRRMLGIAGVVTMLEELVLPENAGSLALPSAEAITRQLIAGVETVSQGGVARDDICLLVAVVTP